VSKIDIDDLIARFADPAHLSKVFMEENTKTFRLILPFRVYVEFRNMKSILYRGRQ